MNNLKKAMKVVKFLRFITVCEWFCSLLSLIGSTIAFFSMLTLQALEKTEFILKIEDAAKITAKELTGVSLIAVVSCFFALLLAGASKRYYTGVIACGTPFSESGADGLCSLGWKHLFVPIAVSLVSGAIALAFGLDASEATYTASISGIGFAYLFLAPFIRYGAELERAKELPDIK